MAQEISIENKAKISTGKMNRVAMNRNPNNYLKFSAEEVAYLSDTLDAIKRDARYDAFPLYAKIGKFVHEFIKYDESFVGRILPLKEILQNRSGVCTEYAKLYNSLARLAGIPAVMIEGAACGEYEKCRGHAWNMVFVNNQWIDVDATWDLMSGIVSSSHIYFSDTDNGEVEVQYRDEKKNINSKIDFEMGKVF